MRLLLLIGCEESFSTSDARDAANVFLEEHPRGTVVVEAGTDRAHFRVLAPPLEAWLAPCGAVPDFDAELLTAPGVFPATYESQESRDSVPACAWDRLALFPFDPPAARGSENLVVVRYRPGEEPLLPVRGAGAPASLTLPPPAWMRTPPGDPGVDWNTLDLDGLAPRIRRNEGGTVTVGTLDDPDQWAELLRCRDTAELVRVTLVFADRDLQEVRTTPDAPCLRERARENREGLLALDAGGWTGALGGQSLVVLDVPGGAW